MICPNCNFHFTTDQCSLDIFLDYIDLSLSCPKCNCNYFVRIHPKDLIKDELRSP